MTISSLVGIGTGIAIVVLAQLAGFYVEGRTGNRNHYYATCLGIAGVVLAVCVVALLSGVK